MSAIARNTFREALRSRALLGLMLAGSIGLLYVAIPELLLGVFTDDVEVLALARPLLLVGAVFQLFDAVAIVLPDQLVASDQSPSASTFHVPSAASVGEATSSNAAASVASRKQAFLDRSSASDLPKIGAGTGALPTA